ncbi:response regulator transcription factor [Undibacterium amnicola]|uniref:Response regulator transcription factor n=1 Tax=Undibacterium amnicola TaxID=1834038 RepID=A0ABR6XQ65_9BURK|nr:response regulator transcription factor [Undibacterium amnicola]MBC3831635.1 response regulator transcription factor [Undibacterium amnicola]
MIHVALVDDQALVRGGISGLLNMTADIRVKYEASDGIEARALLALPAEIDLLLLDIRMPRCSGIEFLLAHAKQLPPAILLTTFDDDEVMLEGIRAGAKGFLLKDISLERLADGIRHVAQGGSLFRPALTERLRASILNSANNSQMLSLQQMRLSGQSSELQNAKLSERETEILALMAAGLSNAEIANALALSEGTIKNYVSGILSKLDVRDRIRAVLRGLESGYI